MRYSRQEKLDFYPKDFTKIISKKKIIIVGCGAIGSILSELLVRCGFSNLILIDNDIIDETNLSRQNFFEEDIGKLKVESLKKNLLKINSKINIEIFQTLLDKKNIEKICSNLDLIIDSTDNFKTRRIINKFCEKYEKDWLYCGAIKTSSISYLFKGKKKEFKKIFPKKIIEQSCCDIGILPSTIHLSAAISFNLILKYFLEIESNLIKIDLWKNLYFNLKIKE